MVKQQYVLCSVQCPVLCYPMHHSTGHIAAIGFLDSSVCSKCEASHLYHLGTRFTSVLSLTVRNINCSHKPWKPNQLFLVIEVCH